MGFCNCSMFCSALLCVHSSFAIILIGKRELVALLSWSSRCLVVVVWLFLMVCLQFVVLVFPDHTHLLFLSCSALWKYCGLSITLPSCILAYVCVLFVSLCSCASSSVYQMYMTMAYPGYIHRFMVSFNVL